MATILFLWIWLRYTGLRLTVPHGKPAEIKPICGCTHHLAFHDTKNNTCTGVNNVRYYNSRGYPTYKDVVCTCKTYIGPTPLGQLYATEIATDLNLP